MGMAINKILIFALIAAISSVFLATLAKAGNSSNGNSVTGTINYTTNVNTSAIGVSTSTVNNVITAISNFLNGILNAIAKAFHLK